MPNTAHWWTAIGSIEQHPEIMSETTTGQRMTFRNKDGLANYIRQLRREHGAMTQQQLAQRVLVTRQTIVALESGRYSPSLPLAIRIARVFERPVEEVFDLVPGSANE